MTTLYVRLSCASCNKILGWRESREDTRWILTLCDDCFEQDKANHERHITTTTVTTSSSDEK